MATTSSTIGSSIRNSATSRRFQRHGRRRSATTASVRCSISCRTTWASAASDNLWWLDVLEWGPDSEYAGWFDIDWDPDQRYLRGKLLVPFLGDQYGAVLESGQLALRFDPETGGFAVWAYDTHKLPICPLHYAPHPGRRAPGAGTAGRRVLRPAELAPARRRSAPGTCRPSSARWCASETMCARRWRRRSRGSTASPGACETWRELDALIKDQHWRAAHFRVAADDINYRRFFNINELAGLRMELPELFDHAHRPRVRAAARRRRWTDCASTMSMGCSTQRAICCGCGSGRRGHSTSWSRRSSRGTKHCARIGRSRARPVTNSPIWCSDCWSIRPARTAFTRIYSDFTGERRAFAEIVRDCKIRIMHNEMASELNVLARDAARVARQNPRTADFTRNILQRALQEIVACFPVYRTYVDGSATPTEADRRDHRLGGRAGAAQRDRRRSERLRFPAPAADHRPGGASRAAASAGTRSSASRCGCSNTAAR